MAEVVVVVKVVAAEGKVDEVIVGFAACVEETHKEEGCIAYALHRDNNDADTLVLVERWRSQEDLDAHNQTSHAAALFAVAGTPGVLVEPPQLTFATSLGLGDPGKGNL